MKVSSIMIVMLLMAIIPYTVLFTTTSVKGAMTSSIYVEGPTEVATNTTVHYKVTLSSIFDVYRGTLLIAGENLTGAEPTDQISKINYVGVFDFKVKTPKEPQRIYLDFRVFGTINATGKTKVFEKKLSVEVKNPYIIHGSIKNIENYTIRNVTVYFYVDNKYVGNITIDKIDANSTKSFTYNWIPDVGRGEHIVEMRVLNNGVLFSNNKDVYKIKIYIGNPPSYDWVLYGGIIILAITSILYIMIIMGRRKRRRSPKWR